MAGGTGQARAAVLVERVVVLLLESLRGAGGSRAQGLRQLPVVEGAAVPRDPGLRREGVAGLRQLPLKPGEKVVVLLRSGGQPCCQLPPQTRTA